MNERRENPNSFKEYNREILLAPINYARELRQRGMDLGDKILLGELGAAVVMIGLLASGSYSRTQDLFHTTGLSAGIIATFYLAFGVVRADSKEQQREGNRRRLVEQQEHYQNIGVLKDAGLIEV